MVFTLDGTKVKAVVNGRDDKVHVTYSGSMKGTLDAESLTGNSGDPGGDPWNDFVCTR